MKLILKNDWAGLYLLLLIAGMQNAPAVFAETLTFTSADTTAAMAFPDETNTGAPAGLKLSPATSFNLDVAGATVSGMDFQGPVTITAPNVTLINCRITASSWAALDIRSDGVTVKNCEIDGQAAPGIRGISVSGNNVTILNSNIHSAEDGIYLTGSSKISIKNNYIHDLQSRWEGPHYDGIATDGGISDVLIQGNTVINPHEQTSAIMLSNYFGPVSGVRLEGNRLIGGGYTIYSDDQFGGGPISNVTMSGNSLGRGFYGYTAIGKNAPEFSANTDDASGAAVGR